MEMQDLGKGVTHLVSDSGRISTIEPVNKLWTMEDIAEALGSDFYERIFLEDGRVIFFQDNFPMREGEVNAIATELAEDRMIPGDYITGPALICSIDEVELT